ncbi:putative bifunctional diguanylate cyclase/phosphodiesterase [Martelella alba]|uniref:putative bifunctional diguanylate cyclase/phosphodiesterase n=1 Tax=Martelella alba TaxID=2590451 RepID=UPI001E622FD4|nr:EAL domain-containing protein [Martelella alba]
MENSDISHQELQTALAGIHDAVIITDGAGNIAFFNSAAERLWGYPASTVLRRKPEEIPLFNDEEASRSSSPDGGWLMEVITAASQTKVYAASLIALPATGNGRRKMIILHIDQGKTDSSAHYDNLTGLPKRAAMYSFIDDIIINEKTDKFALFSLDLDHFKDVNDALGYAAGDHVLAKIAQRLCLEFSRRARVFHADSDGFVVVATGCDRSKAVMIAQRIQALFHQPFHMNELTLSVTASIGISLYPEHGGERDLLFKHANHATHLIKKVTSGGYLFFGPEMNQVDQERLKLAAALKRAIPDSQLHLHYQPQVRLDTGELYGVEALARWYEPTLGEISPGVFIALAEETGEIEAIGRWTLQEACRQMARWREDNIAVPVISVNLSPINFYNSGLPDYIAGLLNRYRLPAETLTIEITEGVMMDKRPETLAVICAVRALGVGLSMDDFGTGFSCLSRLAQLPMTELKIDQSFMRDFTEGSKMKAIATTVVRIGQSLKQTVIAEGVETEQQFAQLRELNCDIAQGFYYSRALNPVALTGWLKSRTV